MWWALCRCRASGVNVVASRPMLLIWKPRAFAKRAIPSRGSCFRALKSKHKHAVEHQNWQQGTSKDQKMIRTSHDQSGGCHPQSHGGTLCKRAQKGCWEGEVSDPSDLILLPLFTCQESAWRGIGSLDSSLHVFCLVWFNAFSEVHFQEQFCDILYMWSRPYTPLPPNIRGWKQNHGKHVLINIVWVTGDRSF